MDLKYRKIVTEHLMCEVKTDISYFDICEMQCYNESTADGYDVYVLKYTIDENKIDSIYIDDYLYGEIYLEDVFEEYFNENVDEIVDDNPELFTKKELKYINEEYDLEIEV